MKSSEKNQLEQLLLKCRSDSSQRSSLVARQKLAARARLSSLAWLVESTSNANKLGGLVGLGISFSREADDELCGTRLAKVVGRQVDRRRCVDMVVDGGTGTEGR